MNTAQTKDNCLWQCLNGGTRHPAAPTGGTAHNLYVYGNDEGNRREGEVNDQDSSQIRLQV